MKYLLLFCCFLLCLTNAALAQALSCAPYLNKKDNTLFNMGIIKGNNPNDNNAEELMPDSEVKEDKFWVQKFYLKKHRKQKLFLICVYQNGNNMIREISDSMNICVRRYFDEKQKNSASPEFYCQ